MIEVALAVKENLTDGDDRVSLTEQIIQNRRQRLRRMLAGIMEQNDTAALHLARNSSADLVCADSFPVETIPNPNNLKPLQRNG